MHLNVLVWLSFAVHGVTKNIRSVIPNKCNQRMRASETKINDRSDHMETRLEINVAHFAESIVLGYHSIPKIIWGSFRGRSEEN